LKAKLQTWLAPEQESETSGSNGEIAEA